MQSWILYPIGYFSSRVILEKVKVYAKLPGKIEIFTTNWSVKSTMNF